MNSLFNHDITTSKLPPGTKPLKQKIMTTKYKITVYEKFTNTEFTGEFTAETQEWAEHDAICFYAANFGCNPDDVSMVHTKEIE